MRADLFTLWTLLGLAAGHAIERRDDPDDDSSKDDKGDDKKPWHPKTKDPHFFNLKVDSRCTSDAQQPDTSGGSCKLEGYAIRLEKGIMIATPYNKWWDPKLPTFFVDDDTSTYTVSKDPLQIFIDAVTGAVKYTKVGWLPPSSISVSFYHTGNNPLGLIDPSPSYWTWPSTYNIAFYGEWWFCPLGETGQYQVFVNNQNFDSSGVQKEYCESLRIAAVNANPWKKPPHPPAPPPPPKDGSYGGGDDGNW